MAHSGEQKDSSTFIPNPPEFDGAPDLSQLVYLEMDHVLHNLHYRYSKMSRKYPYTSISTILVAINPYERLPIYGPDVIEEFHSAAKKGVLPRGRPHPYSVSARSYMRMIQRKKNQSVIVCGESGAGKSETAKLLIRYLALTAPQRVTGSLESISDSGNIEKAIISASPILEAYGNAKTVMNNNSSRFGKFTKLLYEVPPMSKDGFILGSYLETYLLEKSRVVRQSLNERNYHIFYFLHKGLKTEQLSELELSDPKKFHYTNQGIACEVPGIRDVSRWEELVESLTDMRIDSEQWDLWQVTAGILHLGNIEFTEKDGFAAVKNPALLKTISRLWGLTEDALNTRLTSSSMRVNRQTIIKKMSLAQAMANRDSIAKNYFEQCFLYLCSRINSELTNEFDEDKLENILFIGILDVFGFENFWINSLEQFCINFTNEKLQQFFNLHIIKSEQEEYISEGVLWTPISVPDNVHYLDMVESDKTGFFTLLDSACRAPQPSVEAWMQEYFKVHGKNVAVKRATRPGAGNARGKPGSSGGGRRRRGQSQAKFDGFTIKHFADSVTYDASKFIVKNNEAVHGDTSKMLKKSTNSMVVQICSVGKSGRARRARTKKSVSGAFFKGMKTLMKNLKQTDPFFVRCVNPNSVKSSKVWDEKVVRGQLRCGGMIEALKVLKLGYPTRVPYSTLYEKFHSTVTNPLIKNMGPEALSTALLIAFDVTEEDYELGLTKIFFKPAKAAVLDKIMAQAGIPLTPEQNEKITRWIVQKRLKQIVGLAKAFVYFRDSVRRTRAARRWQQVGRVSSILAQSVVRHLHIARANILARKKEAAAIQMQAFFRSSYVRKKHLSRISKTKLATKMVYTAWKRMEERQRFEKWINTRVKESRRIKPAEDLGCALPVRKDAIKIEQQIHDKLLADEMKANAEEAERQRVKAEQAQAEREAKEKEDKRVLDIQKELAKERQKLAAAKKALADERLLSLQANLADERNASIKKKQDKVKKADIRLKNRRKKSRMRRLMPEYEDDEFLDEKRDDDALNGYDSEESDVEESDHDFHSKIRNFQSVSTMGQYFSKYRGNSKRSRPQQRVVKIVYNRKNRPVKLAWGTGSRFIKFDDILYVVVGHWTPVFRARSKTLKPENCLSIISTKSTLDLYSERKSVCKLWRIGLQRLLKQTDAEALEMARKNISEDSPFFENQKLLGDTGKNRSRAVENKKAARDHLRGVQRDLFVLSRATVLREMGESGYVFDVDMPQISFEALYREALERDIPWRQWTQWIRNRIDFYVRASESASVPIRPIVPPRQDSRIRHGYTSSIVINQPMGVPPVQFSQVNPQGDPCSLM